MGEGRTAAAVDCGEHSGRAEIGLADERQESSGNRGGVWVHWEYSSPK